MEKTTVFLSDWQVLFREGIHFTLCGEEDIEVIGEATSAADSIPLIESNPPRVAILNANNGTPSGIDVTRRIKHSLPAVSVMLVVDSDNEEQLFAAIKSGASACITKDIDPDDLINLVIEVAQGRRPICETFRRPGIAARVLDEFEAFFSIGQQAGNILTRLTPREAEILRHISNGSSIEQVNETLGISKEDINYQFELTLQKLVTNDHDREIIETMQSSLLQSTTVNVSGQPTADYITKEEFDEFKADIREHFKNFINNARAKGVTDGTTLERQRGE